jgi:CHAT domain
MGRRVDAVSHRFAVDWVGGAGASIDLFGTDLGAAGTTYQLRYGSPFRSTMRAPADVVSIGENELDRLDEHLRNFAKAVGLGTARGTATASKASPEAEGILKDLGETLFDLVLPRYVADDLRIPDLFIEVGTDESLLHYPWELMRDDEGFLCLRHYVGRFVNLESPLKINEQFPMIEETVDLNVLLICVPQPQPYKNYRFDKLAAAEAERQAIMDTFEAVGIRPDVLLGRDATWNGIRSALRDKAYQIVHFTGHAFFDEKQPRESGLVVHDGLLTTMSLTSWLKLHRAVLCFVNGCETARGTDAAQGGMGAENLSDLHRRYNIYGLAKPFLESGAYLLGTRWNLSDRGGALFASTFYRHLLDSGAPIGKAIREARRAVQEENPGDFAWASYVYYGDPRLRLSRSEGLPEPLTETVVTPGISGALPAPTGMVAKGKEDLLQLDAIARAYEQARAEMPSGPERTRRMEQLVFEVISLGTASELGDAVEHTFRTGNPGDRIVAIALVEAHPDSRHLDVVRDAVQNSVSAFEQYHALVAAKALVDLLSPQEAASLRESVVSISDSVQVVGTDRSLLARQILNRLDESGLGNPVFA